MDRDRLVALAREHLAGATTHPEREAGHSFHHGLRVARLAVALADRLGAEAAGVDSDALFAAGLFHDARKGEPEHAAAGAAHARALIGAEAGAAFSETVARLIRGHNRREEAAGDPVDERILRDADVLDKAGPLAVWMSFGWARTHDQPPDEALAYLAGEAYRARMAELRARLHFDASRVEFDRRLAWEEGFRRDLDRALRGAFWT